MPVQKFFVLLVSEGQETSLQALKGILFRRRTWNWNRPSSAVTMLWVFWGFLVSVTAT